MQMYPACFVNVCQKTGLLSIHISGSLSKWRQHTIMYLYHFTPQLCVILCNFVSAEDKDWADYNGYTALSEAAMAGHTIVVGQLLRANADPNRQASDGRTALHRAAFHGWIPILRLLLEHGADPELKDTDDRTAAELTRKESVTEVIAKGTEEHREIIEKRRLERPKEPLKEVKTVPNLPKRSGPVTRRLVPETASDQDGKQDAQDSKDPRDPRDPKDPKDKENQENQSKDSKDGKDGKFLELHSSLDIVTRPDDFAGRGGPGGYQGEVRLQQGSLIVETSDGLFSNDEVKRDEHLVMSMMSMAINGYHWSCHVTPRHI